MATKQVIVMRTDLNMRKGKMVAQGAHASMAFITRRLALVPDGADVPEYLRDTIPTYNVPLSAVQREWLANSFTKICVGVGSEEELLEIHDAALRAGLTPWLITDNGLTEFNGVPTNTCLALGPDEAERIDPLTGHLRLL